MPRRSGPHEKNVVVVALTILTLEHTVNDLASRSKDCLDQFEAVSDDLCNSHGIASRLMSVHHPSEINVAIR